MEKKKECQKHQPYVLNYIAARLSSVIRFPVTFQCKYCGEKLRLKDEYNKLGKAKVVLSFILYALVGAIFMTVAHELLLRYFFQSPSAFMFKLTKGLLACFYQSCCLFVIYLRIRFTPMFEPVCPNADDDSLTT